MTSENEFLPNSEILSYLSVFHPFQSFTGNYIETRLGLLTGLVYMVASKSQQFIDRSSRRRCSVRIGVLRNFAKFTGKHLCQSLFFNNV